MTILEGIVLKERSFGEQDKFIDVLTKDSGMIELSVRGARKINGRLSSSTQLFAYSRFCMDKRRDRLCLNSAEPIHIFYNLRNSLSKLALVSYFADVLRFIVAEQTDSGNVLRLLLNTLHYLESGNRTETILKCIFELRLMTETGYMPDVVCCRKCGAFEPQKLYFSVSDGGFVCSGCADSEKSGSHMLKLAELSAIRHIALADFNRLYNFRLSDESMKRLSFFSESYILTHIERDFSTLDFYKSIK